MNTHTFRLDGVRRALYLLFNEGYKASSGDQLVRENLCREAIRLTQLLAEVPATNQPCTFALLSLMQFNAARLPARTDDAGNLLRLHEQNRSDWDQKLIQRGIRNLVQAAHGDTISEYHLEAGIAACHSIAADESVTDWSRILTLYDQLFSINPTPIVAMNRAVAVARAHGPQAGLDALDAITQRSSLEPYHLYHAIRGTFAAELGHIAQALVHFRQAGNLAQLPTEREFISRRIDQCMNA